MPAIGRADHESSVIEECRDSLVDLVNEHRKICPDGDACRFAESIVGFLAHSLGVRTLADVTPIFLEYKLNCPGCGGCEK